MNRLLTNTLGIMLALAMLGLSQSLHARTDAAGQLVRAQNDVRINALTSKRGDLFANGDVVSTGVKSHTVLRYLDDTTLFLRESSQIKIDQVNFQADTPASGSLSTELLSGGMRAITGIIGKDNPANIRFDTPVGTIGIRGTDFIASLVEARLFLTVMDGSILFTNPQGIATLLEHGQTLVISSLGEIIATRADAQRMAEEADAFGGLADLDPTSLTMDSVHGWGPWSVPELITAPDASPTMAMVAPQSSGATMLDASGLPDYGSGLNIGPGHDVDIGNGDDFVDVGGSGQIRGQLSWTNSSDLDLHLTMPGGQHVAYYNRIVTLNGVTAELDHDNLGGTIDQAPNLRVENIVVTSSTGNLPVGTYSFYANYFSGSEATSAHLTVTGDGGQTTRSLTETLSSSRLNSSNLNVILNSSGAVSYTQTSHGQ